MYKYSIQIIRKLAGWVGINFAIENSSQRQNSWTFLNVQTTTHSQTGPAVRPSSPNVFTFVFVFAVAFASATQSHAEEGFAACPQFFANGTPPIVAKHPMQRALCYDAFAILHSGESKTPVYVAQRLNRASIADTGEKRSNRFFSDARLRSAERASLDDYKGSGFDRGHMAPAGDMPTAQGMAQSFSLANMVPQFPRINRGVWAKSVESATRKYVSRATGDVYIITGPVYVPSIALSPSIGPGQVRVPKYLFKLVYDEQKGKAWAYWQENANATKASPPISYAELVKRTGISVLPSAKFVQVKNMSKHS